MISTQSPEERLIGNRQRSSDRVSAVQLSGCEEKRIAQSQELKRLLKEKSGKKYLTGKDEGAKLRESFGRDSRRKTSSQFPVAMAKGYHLFPYRTQKLRPSAPMVLGWTRPGRVGRCRNPDREAWMRNLRASLFCGFGVKRDRGQKKLGRRKQGRAMG